MNWYYIAGIAYVVGVITAPWVFYLIRKAGRWMAQLTVRKYEA